MSQAYRAPSCQVHGGPTMDCSCPNGNYGVWVTRSSDDNPWVNVHVKVHVAFRFSSGSYGVPFSGEAMGAATDINYRHGNYYYPPFDIDESWNVYFTSGSLPIYITCRFGDRYNPAPDCTVGWDETEIANINISEVPYITEVGPYDPYNLSIWYDNGTIKTSWSDNLGTCTKQYDRMDIYVRANSSSNWVRVYWEDDDNCEAWKAYAVSPGSQMQFSVYTHTTSNKNSNQVWSGIYTVPGSVDPSGSVSLQCTSQDANMHVRGTYEIKATWSVSGPLVNNPYRVNLWFYDNANPQHTSSNNASSLNTTSRTHAIVPYNMGSRNLNILRAKVEVYATSYYYTPNQDANPTYHTKETKIGEKDILIGTLVQFYVKIINSSTNAWAKGYIIDSSGTTLVPYEKFDMKGAT